MDDSIPDWVIEEGKQHDRDMRRLRRAAKTVMEICDEYRYGDGTAMGMATYELQKAADALGIAEPERPKSKSYRKKNQISRGVQRTVWDRDGWECVTCGSHANLTVDHIMPLARGGSDDLSNLQTMCFSCNSRKGARIQ